MIYERQRSWQPLADLLGPLVASASDSDFERQTQQRVRGGAVWQGTVLMLGQAYEQLGRTADAETAYERVGRLPAPRHDWTLNKTLVALARLKRGHGDLASAQQNLERALDLATEFPDSYRGPYEADTSAEAERLTDQARREERLGELQRSADALVHRSPHSAGAWYELGLSREAACDLEAARLAYARAAGLVRPGSGSFLEGRPSGAVATGCVARAPKTR
jgi:tetratricopeptide (TPR) repeat protein